MGSGNRAWSGFSLSMYSSKMVLASGPTRFDSSQAATLGPAAAGRFDGPPNLVEAGPLYAGECVDRISDIRPAGELVHELAP